MKNKIYKKLGLRNKKTGHEMLFGHYPYSRAIITTAGANKNSIAGVVALEKKGIVFKKDFI